MKALVDERKLSKTVFRNGQLLAPLALIFFSFLIAGSDAWLLAAGSAMLLFGYLMNCWNCRILFLYGTAMLALCGLLIIIAPEHANWAAVQGYWLLAAGTAGMAIRAVRDIRGPASRTANRPARRYARRSL